MKHAHPPRRVGHGHPEMHGLRHLLVPDAATRVEPCPRSRTAAGAGGTRRRRPELCELGLNVIQGVPRRGPGTGIHFSFDLFPGTRDVNFSPGRGRTAALSTLTLHGGGLEDEEIRAVRGRNGGGG